MHGFITGIGAFQLLNSSSFYFLFFFFFFVIYSDFLFTLFLLARGFFHYPFARLPAISFFYSDDGFATYLIYFSRWGFLRHCTHGGGSLLSLPYFLFIISIGSYAPMWASTDNEDHDIPRFHILLHCDDYRNGHLVKVISAIYEIPTWLIAFTSIQNKMNPISQGHLEKGKSLEWGKAWLKLYCICISGFIFSLCVTLNVGLFLIFLWCFLFASCVCMLIEWCV